jgi:hypothetical protein
MAKPTRGVSVERELTPVIALLLIPAKGAFFLALMSVNANDPSKPITMLPNW